MPFCYNPITGKLDLVSNPGSGGGDVLSVFGRIGAITAQDNDYAWSQIDKTVSNIADLALRSHGSLTDIGTNTHDQIDAHIANILNPHGVTAAQAGAVALTGDESIDGVKTFVAFPRKSGTLVATDPTEFITFQQASNLIQGVGKFKSAVLATTGNITLSGEQTIDGVMTSATRVLVHLQSNPIENGIYISGAGAWTRATDFNQDAEVIGGTAVSVIGTGATYSSALFVQNEEAPVVGTDPLVFIELPSPPPVTASLGVKLVGADLEADLDAAGAIVLNGNSIKIAVDAASIEIASNALRVKSGGITDAMLAGSISNGKLNAITAAGKVSGAALTSLDTIPAGAGVIPIINLGTGTLDTTTFLRGDGTFAVPPGGGGGQVDSIGAGDNITVDDTDPENPIVNATNFTPTYYQETLTGSDTTWTLAHTPISPQAVLLFLNGAWRMYGEDFTISGVTVTTAYTPVGTPKAFYPSLANAVQATFAGLSKITVGTVEPTDPNDGDLWIDTN